MGSIIRLQTGGGHGLRCASEPFEPEPGNTGGGRLRLQMQLQIVEASGVSVAASKHRVFRLSIKLGAARTWSTLSLSGVPFDGVVPRIERPSLL